MTGRFVVSKWPPAKPLTGAPMLLCVVAALITPTLIRTSVDGAVEGLGFTPYLPFVLLAALVLRWQIAAGLAAASASLGDFLFVGPRYQLLESPSDVFGVVVFAIAAALAIGIAHGFRKAAADPTWLNGPKEAPKGIVFSQKGGQVYASWYGGKSFVPMGPEAEVAKMMQDFLAQREVGERLASRSSVEHIGSGASLSRMQVGAIFALLGLLACGASYLDFGQRNGGLLGNVFLLTWPTSAMMGLSGISVGAAHIWSLAIIASNALLYFAVGWLVAPIFRRQKPK